MNPDCNFFAYDLVFDYDFVFDYTEKKYIMKTRIV